MGKLTEHIKGFMRRRKPVSKQEAEAISTWVGEGGAFDPEGPPPVKETPEPGAGDDRE